MKALSNAATQRNGKEELRFWPQNLALASLGVSLRYAFAPNYNTSILL